MSFFSSSDVNTSLEAKIRKATDKMELSIDWAAFNDIIDMINNDASDISANTAIRTIYSRLKEQEQNAVNLALLLIELTLKKCSKKIGPKIDRSFMGEMSLVAKGAKGTKNSTDAKRILYEWSKQFPSSTLPLFYETYVTLKKEGVLFDKDEVATSKPSAIGVGSASSGGGSSCNDNLLTPEMIKLNQDLVVVCDQIGLCRALLIESPGIEQDEILSEVVGYLEACRERLLELIDAAASGLLSESLFAKILRINEYVIKTLDAEREGLKTPINDDFNSFDPNDGTSGNGNKDHASSSSDTSSNTPFDNDLIDVGVSAASLNETNPLPPHSSPAKSSIKPIAPPPSVTTKSTSNVHTMKPTPIIPLSTANNNSSSSASTSVSTSSTNPFANQPTIQQSSTASPITKLPPAPNQTQQKAIPIIAPPPGSQKPNDNLEAPVVSPFISLNPNPQTISDPTSDLFDTLSSPNPSTSSSSAVIAPKTSASGADNIDDFDLFLDSLGAKK